MICFIKINPVRFCLHFSFAVLVATYLTGCVDQNMSDLNNYIREVNSRPKGNIEPLPEIKVVEAYILQPEGLRDPFQPIAITGPDESALAGLRPDSSRRKEELESFALDTIQMVGTLSIKSELWGLVRPGDGANAVYRVHVGNYMGTNNGKIIRVTENRIELLEIVQDSENTGVWIEKLVEKELAE